MKDKLGEKILKRVTGRKKPENFMTELMSNEEYNVFETDKKGNILKDENGRPYLDIRKVEIRTMYDVQTSKHLKNSKQRRQAYLANKKKIIKDYRRRNKSEGEIEHEIWRLKELYATGKYPEYRDQDIFKLYEKEVQVKK